MKNEIIYKKWQDFKNDEKYEHVNLSEEEKWFKRLSQVEKYIIENEARPSAHSNDANISNMGSWLTTQTQNYNNKEFIMKKKNILHGWEEFINKYSNMMKSEKESWKEKLENVKKYMNEHNTSPTTTHKNIEINKLGNWLSRQKQNYKNENKKLLNDEQILKLWEEFINDDNYKKYLLTKKEEWIEIFESMKQYILINKMRPSGHSKDKYVKKIGNWATMQHIKYKEKKQIMEDEEIYTLWKNYVENDSNKEHFQTHQDTWIDNLTKVKEYINVNGCRPSTCNQNNEIKKMGAWINTQKWKHMNNREIMTVPEIKVKWVEFTTDPIYKHFI